MLCFVFAISTTSEMCKDDILENVEKNLLTIKSVTSHKMQPVSSSLSSQNKQADNTLSTV